MHNHACASSSHDCCKYQHTPLRRRRFPSTLVLVLAADLRHQVAPTGVLDACARAVWNECMLWKKILTRRTTVVWWLPVVCPAKISGDPELKSRPEPIQDIPLVLLIRKGPLSVYKDRWHILPSINIYNRTGSIFPQPPVLEAIEMKNGFSCADLVSFRHPHIANPRLQLCSPEDKCQQMLEPSYDEMFAAHLRCTYAVSNHDFVEAYKYQTVVVQSFLRIFQAHKEENWALPIMYAITLDLRNFANCADQQLVKKGKGKIGDMLEKAAELLMSCFRVCASDTRASFDDSKKWGMLFLVNQLFRIYFKISKLHLCKPLIRAIDSSNFKDEYAMSQRVTYRYYVGRKAMFDSDFKKAEECLSFAFRNCLRTCQKNKRMILIYLLPVKMLLGHMPAIQLLRKYDLMQFADVTKAVSEGNLRLLTEALTTHETFFTRCGIFLILEKLKIITYRNLFKKVYLLLRTHQLSLDAFLVALKFMGVEDADIEEVNCIVANLIYMGHIKGYVSYQHQKLVVSKQNPFPPLSTIC